MYGLYSYALKKTPKTNAGEVTQRKKILAKYTQNKNKKSFINYSDWNVHKQGKKYTCYHTTQDSEKYACDKTSIPVNVTYNLEDVARYTTYNYTGELGRPCKPSVIVQPITQVSSIPMFTSESNQVYVDGYITSAVVSLYNMNDYIKQTTPLPITTATTDGTGRFTMNADLSGKVLTVTGGTDNLTNQVSQLVLKCVALDSSGVIINPMTTLIAESVFRIMTTDSSDNSVINIHNSVQEHILTTYNITQESLILDPLEVSSFVSLKDVNRLQSQFVNMANILDSTSNRTNTFAGIAYTLWDLSMNDFTDPEVVRLVMDYVGIELSVNSVSEANDDYDDAGYEQQLLDASKNQLLKNNVAYLNSYVDTQVKNTPESEIGRIPIINATFSSVIISAMNDTLPSGLEINFREDDVSANPVSLNSALSSLVISGEIAINSLTDFTSAMVTINGNRFLLSNRTYIPSVDLSLNFSFTIPITTTFDSSYKLVVETDSSANPTRINNLGRIKADSVRIDEFSQIVVQPGGAINYNNAYDVSSNIIVL